MHTQTHTHTQVDPGRAPDFEEAVHTYWPGLPEGSLVPGCK
jgi:hypothetical protein